jgi:hypothetical protein
MNHEAAYLQLLTLQGMSNGCGIHDSVGLESGKHPRIHNEE